MYFSYILHVPIRPDHPLRERGRFAESPDNADSARMCPPATDNSCIVSGIPAMPSDQPISHEVMIEDIVCIQAFWQDCFALSGYTSWLRALPDTISCTCRFFGMKYAPVDIL